MLWALQQRGVVYHLLIKLSVTTFIMFMKCAQSNAQKSVYCCCVQEFVEWSQLIMASQNFSSVQIAPPIEVFALIAAYNEDNHPDKVNLSVGGK